MTRLTLNDILTSRIPPALGLAPTDAKLVQWLNEAQERLLTKGKWWGTYGKFSLSAYDRQITLPPNIATIETVALNHSPTPLHDSWFEFLQFGFGTRSVTQVGQAGGSYFSSGSGADGMKEANYRGNFPTFRELTNNTNAKKIVLQCDLAPDAGSTVTVQGYDVNGNWIRTNPGGIWQDGETIALAQSPGTNSVNTFSRISSVAFSAQRKGQCWLYELDTITNVRTLTGWYQWFETSPSYGRYVIPAVFQQSSTCTPPTGWQQTWTDRDLANPAMTCTPVLVEIVGKLEYRPAQIATDFLIIQSIPALKLAMQAIKIEEDAVNIADEQQAMKKMSEAIEELDSQLDHYLGSGRRIGLTVVGCCGDGMPIETFE